MLKPLLAVALLLPIAPTAAPEELRIPAATGYLVPVPDAVPVSPDRPIRPFVAAGAGIAWFGDFGRAGELEVAVAIRAEPGDTLRLYLSVASSRLEAVVVGTGEEARVALGRVTLPTTGYHRFLLTAEGRRADAAEVRALLVEGASLPQAHFNLDARRNAASVHLRFPVDTTSVVTGFYDEVTAVDDPVTTYYMATGFARGYFGMQVNSATERRIIFSVWDAAGGTNARDRSTVAAENYTQLVAKGEGVVAEVFGNEGTGGHSHLVYPWKTGSRQRFFVAARPEGSATIYSGYWFHPDKQAWVLIASFRAAKDGQGLRRLYAFSENFGGSTGHLRRKALFGPQWIRLADGRWRELTTATFSHDATGKENRGDRFMGVEEGRFFLSHGGFVPGWTSAGAVFTRPATGVPPRITLPGER